LDGRDLTCAPAQRVQRDGQHERHVAIRGASDRDRSPVIGPQTHDAECTAGETETDTRSPGNVWLRAESARRFCAVIG